MSRFQRWLLKTSRTVHVYLTLFGLTLILFFAITGFMLNHIEWFLPSDSQLEKLKRVEKRPLPLEKMPGGKLPEPTPDGEATGDAKLLVVEALRNEFDVRGELNSFQFVKRDVERADGEPETREYIAVEFKRAGGWITATIDRADATAEVVWNYQGWPIVLTDLHRGNRGNLTNEVPFTGRVWSFVIDATCFVLLIISCTGLVMWWSLKSRGKWGAILFVLGTATAFATYYWFVP